MERKKVYELISKERNYQDSLTTTVFRHDKVDQSVPAELAMMKVYLDRAFQGFANHYGDQWALDEIRKVVALGVRCMETNGCPRRGQVK